MLRVYLNARFFFLLCLLALIATPAVWAGSRGGVRKLKPKETILTLEQQWRAATLDGDPASLEKILSDDYIGISWTGQVNTKSMQLDRLRNRTLVLSRMDLSDVKVKVNGAVAIVTSSAAIAGLNNGNEMKGLFRFTRIYQRSPAGLWKITNFEATRVPLRGGHVEADSEPK